jgi:putative ABC transport system permease protein
MAILFQDLTYALRMLVKRPGFTTMAVFTLGLGIAANVTIFSLISAVLLRPLPYPHANRVVSMWTSYPASNGQPDIFSPPNYLDIAGRAKSFEAVGAYNPFSFTIAGNGEPEFIPGVQMTASMGRVLGVEPQIGRWFTQEEDDTRRAVVLLSDSMWRNRFGADREVLGRSLVLNGRSFTIIGVLPPGTGFPSLLTQIYAPISFSPEAKSDNNRGNVFLNVVGRMREGVGLGTAQAELRALASTLAAQYPLNHGISMGALLLQESVVGNVRPLLLVLWAAVAFMLAVGCANVANLLLAHAATRQREFALRRSLGATSALLIRQLLTESATLAGIGGLFGLVLAGWGVPTILAHLPKNFPQLREVALDRQVLWFTVGISLLTGVLFGLMPAIQSSYRDLAQSLREGRGSRRRRANQLLVAGEIAAVMILLVGAGLVLRSLVRLSNVDPGFHSERVIAWQLFLPPARYPNLESQRAFFRTVTEQVETLPGVQAVGLAQPLPFGPIDIVADTGFRIAGRPDVSPDQMPQALITRADAGYFSTMRIPVRSGRVFTARDGETSNAVVISEALARRYFAGEDPIGHHLLLGRRRLDAEIVGVVGDVKHISLQSDARPEFYLPLANFTPGSAGLVVRASSAAAPMLPILEHRIWSIDNTLAGNLAVPVESLLYASLAPTRLATILLGSFAVATLVLGLIGVYGVTSYSVRQSTREIGIRLALGASTREILKMVLGEALALTVVGLFAGLAASLLLQRYMTTLLYDVSGFDPLTYSAVAASVTLAVLAAAYPPAARATSIDPATSLRVE